MMAQLSTRRSFIGGGLATAAVGANAMTTAGHMAMIASGKRLPYDAEVEYLESTGTQWIDTGIRPAQNLSFVVEFNNLNINVGYGNVFGSRLSSNNHEYMVSCYSNGSVGVGTRYTGIGFYTNEINTIVYNGLDELNINGSVKKVVPQSCELAVGNILLFCMSQNGVAYQFANCRIYNVKFGNVRDMIPVRFTNELGQSEGAMYDRVSKQLFRNQGTGAFLYGGDVYSVPVETSQYVQDGLIAMWDGKENAGVGKHSPDATALFDLVSGQTDGGVRSTFVANADNMEVTIESSSTTIPSVFASAVASAISSGFARIEGVVFVNSTNTQYYGNNIGITNGTFGYQYRDGRGGLSMFSSGLVVVMDPSAVNAGAVWLAIDIDKTNSTIEYHVGSQSSGATSIVVPTSVPSSALIKNVGTKIYNMRAYSRALTAAEIAANYAVDKARFNLP